MTFDWQTLLVAVAVFISAAYLVYSLWPHTGDDTSAGCGSCARGCDADQIADSAKPQVKSIVPVEDLLKKRVG